MMPALRISCPRASRSSVAAIRPGWKPSSWAQGLRSPVTSTTAVVAQVQPRAGRQAEQIEAARRDVLAHLPGRHGEAGGAQLVVQLGVDQVDLAQVRLVGSRATRERCLTVAPRCASPSTPSPASSRMLSVFGLVIVCVALRLTAVTTPPIIAAPSYRSA